MQLKKKKLNKIYCENCKERKDFESESLIVTSPAYLVFFLALNDDNNATIKNLQNKFGGFQVEESLNSNDIIKDQNINNYYTLIGMVVYCFDNIDEPKIIEYKAYCRSPKGNNWYKYDNDEKYKISKISEAEKIELLNPQTPTNSFPVILIYKGEKY